MIGGVFEVGEGSALEQSDGDWAEERHQRLIKGGWTELVRPKVYEKGFNGDVVKTGIYIGDCLIVGCGNKDATGLAYDDSHRLLGFDSPNPRPLDKFVGLVNGRMLEIRINGDR